MIGFLKNLGLLLIPLAFMIVTGLLFVLLSDILGIWAIVLLLVVWLLFTATWMTLAKK